MKKLMIAVALAAAVSALTSGQQAFSQDYQQALLNHHPVVVIFDNCNGNIGTIKCGEQYFLHYSNAPATNAAGNMCETTCGVNALKAEIPYQFDQPPVDKCNSNPATVTDIGHGTTWSIDVFGHLMYYNNSGEIFDRDPPHNLIGHMRIPAPPLQNFNEGTIIERCLRVMCARPGANCVY